MHFKQINNCKLSAINSVNVTRNLHRMKAYRKACDSVACSYRLYLFFNTKLNVYVRNLQSDLNVTQSQQLHYNNHLSWTN